MLTKIDAQLSAYDERVGNSLQMISCDPQGRISVRDLERALSVIKHKPDEEVGQAVVRKLDVDQDGYVLLDHVLGLVREEGLGKLYYCLLAEFLCSPDVDYPLRTGLGVVLDDEARDLIGQGRELVKSTPRDAPRKEDIVQE